MIKNYFIKKKFQKGFVLSTALVFMTILIILATALVNYVVTHTKTTSSYQKKSSALSIAEAGINYYLWHLAHNPEDYTDGTGQPGPYVHEYRDPQGNIIGEYSLNVIEPTGWESTVTVESTGTTKTGELKRVRSKLGVPSFSRYSFLTGAECWFGDTESTEGPVHSNIGVHMDGTNNGPIYAGSGTYRPLPQFGGDGRIHNGVWGTGGPQEQWAFPVPTVDFAQITVDLAELKQKAIDDGLYIQGTPQLGYYLHLNSNDTIDVYRVSSENVNGFDKTFLQTYQEPHNGILFVEDDVWIDGTWDSRISIASAKLPNVPASNTSMTIFNNLTYVNKDGSNAIGLIAQRNIQVPRYSPNLLEIDAAMLAQNGHIYRPLFNGNVREKITVYGAIASFDWWTWSWVNGQNQVISGYKQTLQIYDDNLTFDPPPSFPTTGAYAILSWEEY